MASGPAGPLGHLSDELQPHRESDGRGWLRSPTPPLLLPTRRSARCHFRPTTTTQSLWELLSYGSRLLLVTCRRRLQGRMPSTTLMNCGSLIPSRVIRMPIGSQSSTLSRRATPRCVSSLSAGRRPCRPTFWRATLRTSVPPSQTSSRWQVRVDYTNDDIVLLVHNPTLPPTRSDKPNPVGRAACLLNDEPARIYVPLVMRPWIMQARHSTFSCHLGTTRTLRMLERFYW